MIQNAYSQSYSTILTLDSLPSSIGVGETITFSGKLLTESGSPVSGVTIYIKEDDFGPDEIIVTTTTDSRGAYKVSTIVRDWDSYTDSIADIYAIFEGNSQYAKVRTLNQEVAVSPPSTSTTPSPQITVEEGTKLTLDSLPSQIKQGERITFSGRLITQSGIPIANAIISIKDDDTFGPDDLITTIFTDSRGYYSTKIIAKDWDSSTGGASEIYAIFEGKPGFQRSETVRQDVTVFQEFEKSPVTVVIENISIESIQVRVFGQHQP